MDFYSRQLKDVWLLWTVRHFEVYLHGRTFKVKTDHKALEALLSSRVLNHKLMRCALYLQEFLMSITYRPGKKCRWVVTSNMGWSAGD